MHTGCVNKTTHSQTQPALYSNRI